MSHNKLTKHELKEDSFVTFVLGAWEYLRKNQNRFFLALIALVMIVAAGIWMNNSRAQARLNAEIQFSEALALFQNGQLKSAEELFKIIDERFISLREGAYSAYYGGTCALLDGRNTQAIELFESYLKRSTKYPFFRDAAMDGMATAWENERNYEKAAELFLDLVDGIESNSFMEKVYLKRAAENFKLANQNTRAIEILEKLLEKAKGLDRRDIEIELNILRG